MKKDIVFISHATPEDNYFAAWLAAKLKNLGYNVWLDLENLTAGDSFKTVIKPIIIQQAKVFLALTTKSYVEKADDQRSGVTRELNCATAVDTKILGHNFILPLKVDDTPYNNFPYHYMGCSAIDFSQNWQEGLIDIVKALKKFNIPKLTVPENPINHWFDAIKSHNIPIKKEERYYSNWFKLHLPKSIYIHQPNLFIEGEIHSIDLPYILEANRVITFAKPGSISRYTGLSESYELSVSDLFTEDDLVISDNFTLKEPSKKLIKLLNKCFDDHLYTSNLIGWKRGKSAHRKIFYFKHFEKAKRISLKRYGSKMSNRALTGQTNETVNNKKVPVYWSFAIAGRASLYPTPHYKIFYTVVFSKVTDQGYRRFGDNLQHKFRRSIPSDWFNRKWFETLLAAMLKISPTIESTSIDIKIDNKSFLQVDNEPVFSNSEIGYNEPKDD